MGTNYYLHTEVCECCNRPKDKIHIGKSSAGWHFSLHVLPENGINDLADWEPLIRDQKNKIVDEYGTEHTSEAMLKNITERKLGEPNKWDAETYRRNYAEPGLNGLARHSFRDERCVKHGAGTWDCITGDFS